MKWGNTYYPHDYAESLLIAPEGIEIPQAVVDAINELKLLIAPEGIEITFLSIYLLFIELLIAPEGIEIELLQFRLIRTLYPLNRTRRN